MAYRLRKNRMPRAILRRCLFRPYRKGCGPVFTLTVWDTYRLRDRDNHTILGYCLRMNGKVLFEGQDFGCPSCTPIDSDAMVASLMGFLTLRPGDTDREYFANYTSAQLEYCQQHAETLGSLVQSRFCDENGNPK